MATRNDTSSPSRSKKNKRFGSFKGLVNKRKSKNKKNQSQSASASASASQASSPSRPRPQSSNTNRNRDKDDSTVYSVAFDATTTASIPASDNASAKTTPLGEPVHVILLLMDPQTRRFELLQLEFDSATAKVSDITDQIVISATEPSLIIQTFETLTDLKGVELVPNKYIAEYVDSAGVIVAVPSSTKDRGKAVAAMATPILTNPKVHTMVSVSSNFLVCFVYTLGTYIFFEFNVIILLFFPLTHYLFMFFLISTAHIVRFRHSRSAISQWHPPPTTQGHYHWQQG
jgi:hypothetical protein